MPTPDREPARLWTPGDLIRVPAYSGGFRVWRVVGVFLGATNQEGVVEIETLDRSRCSQGRMCVPCELLDALTAEVISAAR